MLFDPSLHQDMLTPHRTLLSSHKYSDNSSIYLNQVSNVHGHLVNLCIVKLLDILQRSLVFVSHEVDGHTLTAESSTPTDPVDVVFSVGRQVVVDDQRDLLDVDTSGQQVSGDQDTGGPGAEFSHDDVPLLLVHVAVHGGDSEVSLMHLLSEPVHLASGVAEDDGLGDGQGLVQVAQGVQLPLLPLHGDVELADTLQGQLLLFHQDSHRLSHEPGRHLQHLGRHRSGQEDHLDLLVEMPEYVVDLVLEPSAQHLVSLVQDKLLDVIRAQNLSADHVEDSAGGAHHDVLAMVQLPHVLLDGGPTNTGVALSPHVVSQGHYHLLDLLGQLPGRRQDQGLRLPQAGVDLLQDGDGEGGGLASTGLSLSDNVHTLDAGDDSSLLDSRRFLKTIGIDTPQELLLQVHVIEVLTNLLPVGVDNTIRVHPGGTVVLSLLGGTVGVPLVIP